MILARRFNAGNTGSPHKSRPGRLNQLKRKRKRWFPRPHTLCNRARPICGLSSVPSGLISTVDENPALKRGLLSQVPPGPAQTHNRTTLG